MHTLLRPPQPFADTDTASLTHTDKRGTNKAAAPSGQTAMRQEHETPRIT